MEIISKKLLLGITASRSRSLEWREVEDWRIQAVLL